MRQPREPQLAGRIRGVRPLLLAMVTAGAVGCKAADDSRLPPDIPDPASLKTPAGAISRYKSAVSFMGGTIDRMITASGIMTDELASTRDLSTTAAGNLYTSADARTGFEQLSQINFIRLNRLRAQTREARGFLAAYAPGSAARQGHLAALEGYADILLADLFCSGIPLSTVNFDGSYTLAAGSSTTQVYEQAVTLFDSADALLAQASAASGISADSLAAFQWLAAVGKGRALLALDRVVDAAAAVAGVPDDYVTTHAFKFEIYGKQREDFAYGFAPSDSGALWSFAASYMLTSGIPGVGDREGTNGLDYRTSSDPRTATMALGASPSGDSLYVPLKYLVLPADPFQSLITGIDTFQLASGIEARLIESEAALRLNPDDGQWLAKLNHLRQSEPVWRTIKPAVSGPLDALADPGSNGFARLDLLFRERAFWLFLTGHRQGDLRRLLRQYSGPGHTPNRVYPVGTFLGGGGISVYGDAMVFVPPAEEQALNPKYTGCIHDGP